MTSEEQSPDTQLAEFKPEHTLDFHVKARGKNKRPYIFRYKKARVCDHPTMNIVARGGNIYRCPDCNYTFQWPGAIVYPLHFNVIMAAFTIFNAAKEFGQNAVEEMLRTPIGQTDGTEHKPVLPEGLSFYDVLQELEGIDVTTPDGGKGQLAALMTGVWEQQPALSSGGGGKDSNGASTREASPKEEVTTS